MTSAPGWYPDPAGLPAERYWNGTGWTEHTRAFAAPLPDDQAHSFTAPLPSLPGPRHRSWYQRKGFIIPAAIVGALIVLIGIGSAIGSPKKNASKGQGDVSTHPASASLLTASTSATHTSASTTHNTQASQPTRTPTTADDGSFVMPDEVGRVLQDAQDDIQRVSEDPIFVSHSHDLLGDRFQVLDGNWKVCDQNVASGQRVSPVGHIDFGVVKLSENCP